MMAVDNLVKKIHHQSYACWDSEETRRFYEDVLGMPLIATVVLEDTLRNDGSKYCHTFFELADGNVLAFFEHMSLFNPKDFTARSGSHCHVALGVGGEARVRQFKCRLDAAGVANRLLDNGGSISLRFNDPNGVMLEFMADVPRSLEYERFSRASAHADLQRWLHYRQDWWQNRGWVK
jgi:catechol 2,3-dioxygenase-like lactoylglutathione lyase family enzyme